MELSEYLDKNKISKADFAEQVDVTPPMVQQWLNGSRPISPIKCVEIEQATNGMVKRQSLRKDDWQKIWPELVPMMAA